MEVLFCVRIHHTYHSFAKSHILVKLTNLQLERIVQTAAITNIKKDVVIYKNGDLCDKLIVILEGSASFSRNELITKGIIYYYSPPLQRPLHRRQVPPQPTCRSPHG